MLLFASLDLVHLPFLRCWFRSSQSPTGLWGQLNKAKCKVLHMGQNNPRDIFCLSREWMESSSEEKDLGSWLTRSSL